MQSTGVLDPQIADFDPWIATGPLSTVYISGLFEILGGLGLLVARTRVWAGWGLIALLVAVYPANIHMAMNPELFPDQTVTALYARLPFRIHPGPKTLGTLERALERQQAANPD